MRARRCSSYSGTHGRVVAVAGVGPVGAVGGVPAERRLRVDAERVARLVDRGAKLGRGHAGSR